MITVEPTARDIQSGHDATLEKAIAVTLSAIQRLSKYDKKHIGAIARNP
jgi:hypothetical protein